MHWVSIPLVWLASTANMTTGRIQIFAKAPLPGLAKSRLVPVLGEESGATLQAHFIRHTLTTAIQMPLSIELWCAPDIFHPLFASAVSEHSVHLYPQQGNDLGARMYHALESGLSRGGPVLLIGTDCPTLMAEDLHEAFAALAHGHDAVLGPSADGGYYLIGLNVPLPQLFNEMPWSTSSVLNETRARLRICGKRWHELRTLHDIDTPADLVHLPPSLKQVVFPMNWLDRFPWSHADSGHALARARPLCFRAAPVGKIEDACSRGAHASYR